MKLQQLLSQLRQAVDDFDMIADNDTVAVGLSGGKDSMTLLYGLKQLQRFYPKKFQLTAITVDLGFQTFDLEAMGQFCSQLQVPFRIVDTQIADIVFRARKESNPCSLCAKMRKGALNQALLEEGIHTVAYAHHRDDLIETLLLSLLFEGSCRSFAPKTKLDQTGITVIRPLLYVREADMKGFCNRYQIAVTKSPCPMDGHTKRAYVKGLIRQLNAENPGVKDCLYAAALKNFRQQV